MLTVDVLCYSYFFLLEDIFSKCNSPKELHFLSLLAQTRRHLEWQIWPQKQKTSSKSAEQSLTLNLWHLSPHDVSMSQIQR